MQLSGSFQGFDLAHLLQMLASTGKSGKIRVAEDEDHGLILLRGGRIIYAISSSARESLGSILLSRGLVSRDQLDLCLTLQRESKVEQRLGAILVETGFLKQEALESSVAEQLGRVISEFLRWRKGFFEFDELHLPDRGEVELETRRLALDEGMPADQILLGITSELSGVLNDRPEALERAPADATSFRVIMSEFPAPLITAEIAENLLELACKVVQRAVLFQVGPRHIVGMTQFGIEPPDQQTPDFVRSLRVGNHKRSLLTDAIDTRSLYQGPLEETEGNRALIERLGGSWPDEVLAGPLLAGDKAMMVFYGDNLPDGDPIGDTKELSAKLLESGTQIEQSLLGRIA